ncbi:two-component system, NtrC family, response regulator/two-component system, NtrC family, response regulator PilR [Mariprofundus ferrinatatus]|uniref:Two-component system, NtrC family, response regulator/two-component system, NtrC family, response regulator PilR n=1 Tax=Mariprofundus ferrinatatus TaxID=1921087 RepID=A0A2K8L577_9PROT|nr:sigma-54 dependent transcriptional regulator [Mariprofundus ferrinatatus]ATX82460.1 two-component system, NtrC family, response regulator/two-component system, NtrC family, response regulator PilR [Mariprofundus ferrinatatus]
MKQTVLVVDDNDINRLNLKLLLKESYQILEAGDLEVADSMLSGNRVDLVVLDLALPPEPDNPEIGMGYLQRLRKESPDTPVVVITGHDERSFALRAQKMGALDFFGKPFDPDEVKATIDRSMEARWKAMREQEMERALQSQLNTELLGESGEMCELRQLIEQVASAPSTVLIRGETGTGKELIARTLHAASSRAEQPFIAINCAAMSADLLESELFGYEMGAFAGAGKRKLGWFERASGGTLFLDEVAGLPLPVQAKLLRVLETGEFSRLGGDAMLRSDVRLICSTREDLERKVSDGSFRDDLYYRIHVVEIVVPPLREHLDDLPKLADAILLRKAAMCGKRMEGFSEDVIEQFSRYSWPGNVRELENVIERAVVLAAGDVVESIPSLVGPQFVASDDIDPLQLWFQQLPESGIKAEKAVAEFERQLVEAALERNHHIKARAGRWLGFGERAKDKMRYLCDKYDIDVQEGL